MELHHSPRRTDAIWPVNFVTGPNSEPLARRRAGYSYVAPMSRRSPRSGLGAVVAANSFARGHRGPSPGPTQSERTPCPRTGEPHLIRPARSRSTRARAIHLHPPGEPMSDAAAASAESEIRAIIERRVAAVRARDVDGAMEAVADDVLTFDVVNTLQYHGAEAARGRAEEWFATFSGPIGFEMRDLAVAAGGDVAFSHSLN